MITRIQNVITLTNVHWWNHHRSGTQSRRPAEQVF
jgi:hypothetical protein